MTSLARRAGLAAVALGILAGARPALAQRPRAKAPPSKGTAGAPALPEAAARQRTVLEKVIHRERLPNGMDVIVVENHGVPLATVEIDVKNGAFTQTHEYEGLAH